MGTAAGSAHTTGGRGCPEMGFAWGAGVTGEWRDLRGSSQKPHSSLTIRALCRFHLMLRTAEGVVRSQQTLMKRRNAIYWRGEKIKENAAALPRSFTSVCREVSFGRA